MIVAFWKSGLKRVVMVLCFRKHFGGTTINHVFAGFLCNFSSKYIRGQHLFSSFINNLHLFKKLVHSSFNYAIFIGDIYYFKSSVAIAFARSNY